MNTILWGSIAGGLAGIVSSLILARFHILPRARAAESAEPKSGAPLQAPSDPDLLSEQAQTVSSEAISAPNIASEISSLSAVLAPLAEEIGHPRELLDMPQFQAVLAALRRPDATLALLRGHAFGTNWPLASAAFVVLAEHQDRQSLCEAVLRHLPHTRPYVLMYALRFLTSLEHRPALGMVIVAAPKWWPENAVIPGFIEEYFARSADLGDVPTFGDHLEKAKPEPAVITELLHKVHHGFAAQLLSLLSDWEDTRIDREFLGTVGKLWDPAEQDPFLVLPDVWKEALVAAEAAMTLGRPRSVLVTGDPQVGKTTFIQLLGRRLQQLGWTIFAASGNELMADQIYIGQLEGRIRKIVGSLHARRKIVWYVRDLGQMAESGTHRGQSASMLDQILPAIAAGKLIVIGESSRAAAARLFQSRSSLRSLMEVMLLEPMNETATSALARQVADRIAAQGGLIVPDQAIATTMDLAQHYLGSGQLPGVVLELLKRAASRSISAGEAALGADSVVATLSQISGLPAVILDTTQRADLAEMHDFFTRRVVGQDEAVRAVVDRIAMLKAGLTDPRRPIGVFLFAGPTGTGKTELAKTLGEFLFGSPERMTRLDMSEFQTSGATTKILGQRGEVGGSSLIDRIRKQPFSVVLLDEFEKAHPNCWDLFLQIFDDGRLSDANGREADFRHCIIILTSNLGATAHRGGGLGFRHDTSRFTDEQVMRAINQTFRPEFVNRLDKVIVFQPLSRDLMRDILHKELARLLERRGLRERAWAVEWESSAIEFLLDKGFSSEMGARPLKRAIDQLLLAPLAATLVEHRFPQGDQFLFVRSNGRSIEVEFVDPDAPPASDIVQEEAADDALSLPSIILSQSGSAAERSALTACWREITGELAGEAWRMRIDGLRLDLADPAIWSRPDRHRVFSGLELTGRIEEAARSAERIYQRYSPPTGQTARSSRELAGRLALQLYNLRQGIDDLNAGTPVDVLVRVGPALDAGSATDNSAEWCDRILDMYRQWATRRRMQLKEIAPNDRSGSPILLITGFGAFRTLKGESGLHVLETDGPSGQRRTVCRVTTASGPDQGLPAANEFAAASQLLASAPAITSIIRRYREEPSPLVRDLIGGWRSGRLAAVLGGNFDLIGAIKTRQPSE